MSTDAGSPISLNQRIKIDLPKILKLTIRRIRYQAPKLKHFQSSLAQFDQAIEFTIETDGDIPTRSYGPALFVGEVEINHSERLDERTWRFLQFEPKKLKRGAAISWGWMKDPKKKRIRTKFRYEPPAELE